MGSLVSHRAALESRGGGKLRRPLLKGKGSHDPSHGWPPRLGTSSLLQSALALLLGAIKLCSAWAAAKQAEVHAPDCASHGHQQETVPMGHCLTWALMPSL